MIEGLIYVLAIRLLVPLLIFRWPFYGFIAALLGDAWGDAILLDLIGSGFGDNYHQIDKLLDLYMFTIAMIASFKFKALERNVSIALYALRAAGILLFELTHARIFLVLFPNVFEFFFVFITGAKKFFPKFNFTKKNAAIILIALAVPKIIQEILMHQLGFDLLMWNLWLKIKELLL